MARRVDEMTAQKVANVAHRLRNNTDLFVDKHGILSIDSWTFSQIVDCFSLILDIEQATDFQVLPSNNRDIHLVQSLQFIYDIFQRIHKIKIWTKTGQPLPIEQSINVRCLRNIYSLEIDKLNITQLLNLQCARPNLKILILRGVDASLNQILCPRKNIKLPNNWPLLEVAVFSHCKIQLDDSLQYATALQALDLSYCNITDASPLIHLPCLKKLNLGFNKLTSLPAFSTTVSTSLVSLLVPRNLLLDISNLSSYTNLEELNLSHNLLSSLETLVPLKHLPQLRILLLAGNPLTHNINNRIYALRILNSATAYCDKFILDGKEVTTPERREMGCLATSLLPSHTNFFTRLAQKLHSSILRRKACSTEDPLSRHVVQVEVHAQQTTPKKSDSSGKKSRRKPRKSIARTVVIHDPPSSYPAPPVSPIIDSIPENKSEEEEEKFVPTYDRNYPMCQDMEHADQVLEEILQANGERLMYTPQKDYPDYANDREDSPSSDCKESQLEASFFSSTTSSIYKISEQLSRQSSDITPLSSDEEDSSSNENEVTYLARKNGKDILIQISDSHFRERKAENNLIMCQWDVVWIESLEQLSSDPVRVKIVFQSPNRMFKPQICLYEMVPSEYQGLKNTLDPIMEKNVMRDICQATMTCLKCEAEFSKPNATVSKDGGTRCPNCGGGVLLDSNTETSPVKERDPNEPNPHQAQIDEITKTFFGEGYIDPFFRGPRATNDKQSEGKGPDDNSVDGTRTGTPSVCDSSSSIEVISETQGDLYKNEHQTIQSLVQGTDAPMQESTSSGSMAGSVCTTVDRYSVPNTPQKHLMHDSDSKKFLEISGSLTPAPASSTPIDSFISTSSSKDADYFSVASDRSTETMYLSTYEPQIKDDNSDTTSESIEAVEKPPPDFTPWLESLTSSLTGFSWPWWDETLCISSQDKPYKPILYNNDDPSNVDHRIKLFGDLMYFKGQDEHLKALTKCVVFMDSGEEFVGLIMISSHQFYVMKIVGEETDDPQQWAKEKFSCPFTEITSITTLLNDQGFSATVQKKEVLFLLADSQWTITITNFLADVLQEEKIPFERIQWSSQQEKLLSDMCLEICEDEVIISIKAFLVVTYMQEIGQASSQFMVVTDNYILLFQSDLEWYSPANGPARKMSCTATEQMLNITGIEVFSDNFVSVIFDNGKVDDSRWNLHMASPSAIRQLIQGIRQPWTQMFDIDLENIIAVYRGDNGNVVGMSSVEEPPQCESTEVKNYSDAWYNVFHWK